MATTRGLGLTVSFLDLRERGKKKVFFFKKKRAQSLNRKTNIQHNPSLLEKLKHFAQLLLAERLGCQKDNHHCGSFEHGMKRGV
jgi:hypothetical protein